MTDSRRTLLIVGATGKQGGAALDALLARAADRFRLRALTRDPNSKKAEALRARAVEVVKGDLADEASLAAALKGAYGLFLVTDAYGKGGIPGEVKQGITAVDAAHAAGVRYVVFTSVGGLGTELGRRVPHFASKLRIEEHIKAKGFADGWAVLRPVFFFENYEMMGPLALGKLAFLVEPGVRVQQIATRDIGEFAAMAFLEPDRFRGRALEIAGDDLSMAEVAARLGEITGVPFAYSQMAPMWLIRIMSSDMYLMLKFFEEEGYKADIPALRALKPDLRDFRAWARSRGIGNVAKGENTYKFAQPAGWGPYLGAAAVAAAAVGVAWYAARR